MPMKKAIVELLPMKKNLHEKEKEQLHAKKFIAFDVRNFLIILIILTLYAVV